MNAIDPRPDVEMLTGTGTIQYRELEESSE